uniref:disease resistance protein RPS2-like n=1 Tax=Erigeron canadensis TaxID=72917 RepID=UPI001CB91E7A|nr:disease resistance protein RPS2-like [Erigeron canadensis]
MRHNKRNKLKVPDQVKGWLEDVQVVNAKVESLQEISVGSCFSFKTRHGVGKRAFGLIQEIKHLKEEHTQIVWTNHPIPLGKVDSMKASTSAPPVDYQSDFESREDTFVKALKALEADHKSHVIALWGMGGVGKTTMMEKLKTVVTEKRMFSLIVPVAIGEFPHKHLPYNHVNNEKKLLAIQDAVADYLAINLKEITTISAKADKLRGWFENYSEGGKNKILVILDDIWQFIDLKDIGLSPFPDQGVDFKVLLTSRSREVCINMGVETNSIFNVKVLSNAEAHTFFWQFVNDSTEADLDPGLRMLGDVIVGRCGGLPMAIKTVAKALIGKSTAMWDDTRTRLQHHDIGKTLNEIFKVSYNNLEDEETKSVFVLCVLYPEDFDIPTEELVRYGWGLKLFNKVYTIRQARNRLYVCIEQLVNANLLIESNGAGSIKMHDLVRAFVLEMYSKAEHGFAWKIISLECKGMKEFPRDLTFHNPSFLKLMHADGPIRFPENFYRLMEKLQVIVYEKMQYPLLPGSLDYSINLRTLCLQGCSLSFDSHSIGSLSNLEVLSFANCEIKELPSTVGNLIKLKLLDLTGCVNLQFDDGVLKNLVKLEELYMRVGDRRVISFIDGNFNEFAERSKNLSTLEFQFFGSNVLPKRISFINLERFKISVGFLLREKYEMTTSCENTLMLVSNKGELLESGINMLFEKTVVLHLQVDDMDVLEDFKCSSFHGLRVLNVSKCAQLRYLFTRRVASSLSRLEHLEVRLCNTLQTLIYDNDGGSETIRFPSLKFLSLRDLPKLVGLCNTSSVIELAQLTDITLIDCGSIKYLFSSQTFKFLRHVKINRCEVIEEIVSNKDDEYEEMATSTSTHKNVTFFPILETLQLRELKSLQHIGGGSCNSISNQFQVAKIDLQYD